MAEIDVNAYATTAANAAATLPSVIETQQPAGTGALRQVVTLGDPTTRANMQTIKAASTAVAATDLPAVVALHPSSPTPTGTNSIGRAAIDQTTNIIAATTMQNAAVAVGNGVNLNVQGYTTAIISITGTMSAGTTIAFKASPDDVFFDFIAAHQLGVAGNLVTSTTNIGNYRINCTGFKSVQAIITTYGAGTVTAKGTVSVLSGHPTTVNANIIAALPTGTNNIGAMTTTDGTNVANVLKADGTAVGQNSQLVAGAYLMPTTYALTSTTQNTPWLDMANYSWVAVESSITAGGLTYQTSNDTTQTANSSVILYPVNGTNSPTSQNFSSALVIVHGPRTGRYFRVSSALATTNTASVTITLFTNPTGISQLSTTAPNLTLNNSGLATSLAQVGGSDGSNARLLQTDTTGNLKVMSSSPTGSAIPANAFLMGMSDGTNLQPLKNAANLSDSGGASLLAVATSGYNGGSYDRQRVNYNAVTGDVGAKTISFAGVTQTNYSQQAAYITVLCGTVSGTTPTLTAQLQWSPDVGTTWLNLGTATTAITTTANTALIMVGPENWSQAAGTTPATLTTGATTQVALNAPLPRTWRLNYVIGGTTPSFAITGVYINYVGV